MSPPVSSSSSVSGISSSLSSQSSTISLVIKGDVKCPRVKCISFHPTRPWVLVSLYTGQVHIYDYALRTIISKYEGHHEGPVRACIFHPSQPLFATGSDDGSIKVFNWEQKRLLFILTGHIDYIRHLTFHTELPWLMSSSDDQTIRIWNWQNRSQVAMLTGHSHYVMCAQFMATGSKKQGLSSATLAPATSSYYPYVISASLDQTVRVWDISNVYKRHSAAGEGSRRPATSSGGVDKIELFGGLDGQVKFVLDHERGVNWVAVHPDRPDCFLSASDDRAIRVWQVQTSQTVLLETLKGHQNNVSCITLISGALSMNQATRLISASEDRTLRIWESPLSTTPSKIHFQALHSYRRERDRFWIVMAHPTLPLLGAGHDGGFMLFKLGKERIPMSLASAETLVYFRPGTGINLLNLLTGSESSLASASSSIRGVESLCPVLSEGRVVLGLSGSQYCIIGKGLVAGNELIGQGTSPVSLGRGRVAVLSQQAQQGKGGSTYSVLLVSVLDNSTLGKWALDSPARKLLPCPALPGFLLVVHDKEVQLINSSGQASNDPSSVFVQSLPIAGAKHCAWTGDGLIGAISTRNSVYTLVVQQPSMPSSFDLTIGSHLLTVTRHFKTNSQSVKSMAWVEEGSTLVTEPILVYCTPSHIRYALPRSGDEGILGSFYETTPVKASASSLSLGSNSSTPSATYLVSVTRHRQSRNLSSTAYSMAVITRGDAKYIPGYRELDLAEPLFKRALRYNDKETMTKIIKEGHLIGQNIIQYLVNQGHASIALRFVKDPTVRLRLAIKAADLEATMDAANSLNTSAAWSTAAEEALRQGKPAQAQEALLNKLRLSQIEDDHTGDYSSSTHQNLALIYLCSGQFGALSDLASEASKNPKTVDLAIQAALFAGDWKSLVSSLDLIGQSKLARFIQQQGDTQKLSNQFTQLPVDSQSNEPWPLSEPVPVESPWLELEHTEEVSQPEIISHHQPSIKTVTKTSWLGEEEEDALTAALENEMNFDAVETGTDRHEPLSNQPVTYESNPIDLPDELVPLIHPLVAKWIDTGIPLRLAMANGWTDDLKNAFLMQAGINNPEPLKALVKAIYETSWVEWTTPPGGDMGIVLRAPVLSQPHGTTLSHLESLWSQAMQQTTEGKFTDALTTLKDLFYHAILSQVSNEQEQERVFELMQGVLSYTLALGMELARKKETENGDITKSLQLAILFAYSPLEIDQGHIALASKTAITALFKAKCYRSAGLLAKRLLSDPAFLASLTSDTRQSISTQMHQVLSACDRAGATSGGLVKDSVPGLIHNDQGWPICAYSYRLITSSKGWKTVECPVCKAAYIDDPISITLCKVCGLHDLTKPLSQPQIGLKLF